MKPVNYYNHIYSPNQSTAPRLKSINQQYNNGLSIHHSRYNLANNFNYYQNQRVFINNNRLIPQREENIYENNEYYTTELVNYDPEEYNHHELTSSGSTSNTIDVINNYEEQLSPNILSHNRSQNMLFRNGNRRAAILRRECISQPEESSERVQSDISIYKVDINEDVNVHLSFEQEQTLSLSHSTEIKKENEMSSRQTSQEFNKMQQVCFKIV